MMRRLKPLLWVFAWLSVAWWAFWLSLDGARLARFAQTQLNPQIAPLYLGLEGVQTEWFGLSLARIELSDGQGRLLAEVSDASLSWAPWHLLRAQIAAQGKVYQGQLEAQLRLYSGRLALSGAAIEPNRNLWLRQRGLITSNPKARFSGHWALWGTPSGAVALDLVELTLTGKSEQTNLMVDLPQTRLPEVHVEAKLTNQLIELEAKTQGDLSGTLQGRVDFVAQAPMNSHLNLRLNAQLKEAYLAQLDGLVKSLLSAYQNAQGRISVELSGPARAPQIKRI